MVMVSVSVSIDASLPGELERTLEGVVGWGKRRLFLRFAAGCASYEVCEAADGLAGGGRRP